MVPQTLGVLGAALAVFLGVAGTARAQVTGTYPSVPLASKIGFTYPSGIPYKVDTDEALIRGRQHGYNICNATTENQESLCQTSIVNSLDDFCLWAPSEPNSEVANTEGEMVAWCTKPGRGTRLIPAGALTGVQFIRTPDYISLVGFIDQELININKEDYGGEMDPHGADLRGNPMGGIMFSNAFGGQYQQIVEWHNFMGGNAFCLKACSPQSPLAARYCEHIFDRIGCAYNVPSNAQPGTFESCLGDNQDFPGIYTDAAGATQTYTQPPESLGPIGVVGYTARVPASSSCVQVESASVYTALPTPSTSVSAAGESGAQSGNTGRGSRTGSAALASSTADREASGGALQGAVAVDLCVLVGAAVFTVWLGLV